MEEKFLFNRKSIIILIFLLALLTLLPVSADENITSDISCQDNGCLSAFDVNQSLESQNMLCSIGDDNLTAFGSNDSLGESEVTYHRAATKLYSDKFTQNSVDSKAGEKGGYFSLYLTTENGKPLSNRTVMIGFNGVTYDVVTNEVGYARLQINLAKAGSYTFAVAYLGDNYYYATMDVYTVKITKKPTSITANAKAFKSKSKTKKYTVTLKTVKAVNGKTYLSAGKKITLKLNGKTYSAKTNAKGKATFSLKITKKGKFKATVKFAGDNVYKSFSKKAYITIR